MTATRVTLSHMKRLGLIALLTLVLPAWLSAQIYRHVDEDGNVSYSDQPGTDANEVQLEPVPTYEPRVPPRQPRSTSRPAAAESAARYSRVRVVSPQHEAVVRANDNRVTVNVASEPALRDGHVYRLSMNGEIVGRGREQTFELTDVYRGEYRLVVEIVRGDDDVVAQSEPSVFYMLQASRLAPNR